MKSAIYNYIISITLILSLFSCKTELEPNATWKEIAIVYGVLDANEPYQVVKISKAYLNEKTNALDLAKITDSVYYKPEDIEVSLFEYNEKGSITNTFKLSEFESSNRPEGVFPAPNQKLYKTDSIILNPLFKYRFELKNLKTGYVAEATTSVVSDFCLVLPIPLTPNIGACENTSNMLQGITPEAKESIQWQTRNRLAQGSVSNNANAYKLRIKFHFKEINGNDTLKKEIITTLADDIYIEKLQNGGYTFDGKVFQDFLKNSIDISNDRPTTIRKAGEIELIIYAAAEELATYIKVSNSPFTAVTQVQPVYTNIKNGVGIFSSRYRKVSYTYLNTASVTSIKANLPDLKFQ